VVPVLDEELRIGRTLEALLAQSLPHDRYEIVVVDNGSTDATRAVVARYPVRCLRESRPSSYAARNAGAAATSGDYLAFLDADCVPGPDWLECLLRCDEEARQGLVSGRIEYHEPARETLGSRLLMAGFSVQARRENVELRSKAAGGNLLVHRQVFEEIGGFEAVVSGGDSTFTEAAARAGYKVVYADEAVVWHPGDISNGAFLRRSFRIQHGKTARLRDRAGALADLLRRLPWRPVFRMPAEVRAVDPMPSLGRRLAWPAFLWLNAWMRWGGALCAVLGLPYTGDRPPAIKRN
jgi:glycosyltransferase involved in cell wall biosynthesis